MTYFYWFLSLVGITLFVMFQNWVFYKLNLRWWTKRLLETGNRTEAEAAERAKEILG